MSNLHYVHGQGVLNSREMAFRSSSRPRVYIPAYQGAPWTGRNVRHITSNDSPATAARLFRAHLAQQAWRKAYAKKHAPAYHARLYGRGAYGFGSSGPSDLIAQSASAALMPNPTKMIPLLSWL